MSDALRERIATMLDLPAEEIGDGDNLLDHGLDSIRMMSIVEELRAAGTDVSFADLAEEPTLQRWNTLLTRR